jgi:hypothetical protein
MKINKNISELTDDLFSIFLPMDIKYKERLNMFLLEYKDLILEEVESKKYLPYTIIPITKINNK